MTMIIQASPSIPVPAENEDEAAQIARSVFMQPLSGAITVDVKPDESEAEGFVSFADIMHCFHGSGYENGKDKEIYACDSCPCAKICSNETKGRVLRHLAKVEYLNGFNDIMSSPKFASETEDAARESAVREGEEKEIPDTDELSAQIMDIYYRKLNNIDRTFGAEE